MYDYASQWSSPIQTYPIYAMPYPHYPSWCVWLGDGVARNIHSNESLLQEQRVGWMRWIIVARLGRCGKISLETVGGTGAEWRYSFGELAFLPTRLATVDFTIINLDSALTRAKMSHMSHMSHTGDPLLHAHPCHHSSNLKISSLDSPVSVVDPRCQGWSRADPGLIQGWSISFFISILLSNRQSNDFVKISPT